MHILLTNDDGPPSDQSSPYILSLFNTLQRAGHLVSVVLPDTQRSWIGKAHMVGQTLTPTYYTPGTNNDNGTTSSTRSPNAWVLLNGTPASCTQIGAHHLFTDRPPIDAIVSGPNYGRNTTALFALSSGTLGAALEGATLGKRSIAISYAFDSRDHDFEIVDAASRVSTKLIEKFVGEWPEDVHVYSINVPLKAGVETQKVVYTEMLQNRWSSGSCFKVVEEGEEDADPEKEEKKIRDGKGDGADVAETRGVSFKWAPSFQDVRQSSADAGRGDGWHVLQGHVTVTPLKANFWHLPHYTGEIKLDMMSHAMTKDIQGEKNGQEILAIVQYPDDYVQPLIEAALRKSSLRFRVETNFQGSIPSGRPSLQIRAYEELDFEVAMQNPKTLICAYVIRKALIRKHFLSNTVSAWLAKHPESSLKQHVKPGIHFELDYAEFLDDALVDAWDLHESMGRNQGNAHKEWWILKPGMSDGGNGIRLFSDLDTLQGIFEEWDPESDEDDDGLESVPSDNDVQLAAKTAELMTSQLRHFIVQPYIDPPLLLPSYGNRKFHIRCYVVAVGALKVFVYREMLALFAAKQYESPSDTAELSAHLTNTCFQDDSTKGESVHTFWSLNDSTMPDGWQQKIFDQIHQISGEIFEAAAREQMVHFQVLPNAFEIFGVDFLVDSNMNAWLLELNAYPDFKQTGQELQEKVVGGLFEDVVKTAILPFFEEMSHASGTETLKLVRELDLGRR